MSKGQRAMAVAMAYPETEQGKQSTSLKIKEVNQGALSQARTVLRVLPELAAKVLAGREPLNLAYEKAVKERGEARTREELVERIEREAPDLVELASISLDEATKQLDERKAEAARLNVIRKTAPDLVARVNDAMITVDEALAIHRNREAAKQAAQEGATHRLEQIMTRICLGDRTPEHTAARLMESSI
jgi:hypothetical protein